MGKLGEALQLSELDRFAYDHTFHFSGHVFSVKAILVRVELVSADPFTAVVQIGSPISDFFREAIDGGEDVGVVVVVDHCRMFWWV